jgi:pimeloyl-ACP methyl ester carboxylesterase
MGNSGVKDYLIDRTAATEPEEVAMLVHGADLGRTLIYLPGLHGDWTLIGRFRMALRGRVRFVEVTYPRTLTWSLEDYAEGVERALAEQGIKEGWLLAESFSSAVLWPMVARKRFGVQGVILAGGFVRHPMARGIKMAEWVSGAIPLALLTRILFGYARLARFHHRNSPETRANIEEFIARRTRLDEQAARHRLHLLTQSDPRPIARETGVPIYGIAGLFDPVVPWYFVRRWLKRNCPSLREYRVIRRSEHNVLGTAAETAAEQVVEWMGR